jgi:hypothetical protein
METLPFTRLCIDCARQSEEEVPNIDRGRPRHPVDTMAPEGEMNERGRQDQSLFAEMSSLELDNTRSDRHATGTAGGGTPFGGLAGGTQGHGDPDVADLSAAHASGQAQRDDAFDEEDVEPKSGPAGGAVGGTPVGIWTLKKSAIGTNGLFNAIDQGRAIRLVRSRHG